jgi:decaprenyl-phosphate phosphoribosyltransferase
MPLWGRALTGLLHSVRPQQWPKNLLVCAVPLTAARFDLPTATTTTVVFGAFCLAASSVYLFNDALDLRTDRMHPVKSLRPIAAGTVPVPLALSTSAVTGAGAVCLAATATPGGIAVVATYLGCNAGYCLWLKHVVFCDLLLVSSGFALRTIAGGLAAGLAYPRLLPVLSGLGALFVVSGKRYSECLLLGERAALSRPVLKGYSPSFLRAVCLGTALAVTAVYCAWALSDQRAGTSLPWPLLSVGPFVLALYRYAQCVRRGDAESPESVLFGSPALRALGALWVVLLVLNALDV